MNRRLFLKTSVAAGAAFSAISILGADTKAKYRTAIIGTGWWGMNILGEAMLQREYRKPWECPKA